MQDRKRWLALACTLALMALIFALSAQDGAASRLLSNRAAELVENAGAGAFTPGWFSANIYVNIRKWGHIYLYAALGASMALTVHLWSRAPIAVQMARAALFCLLYAASDELHQFFVPGRAMLWQDIFVDAAGFLPGIAAVWALVHWRTKHPKNRQ